MQKTIFGVVFFLLIYIPAVQAGFVDNGDGTITDTHTGLMWAQASHVPVTWEGAITHCETLSLAGHPDWRLPNRNELTSLVDYSKYNPSIDTAFFPGNQSSYYWSSTTHAYGSGGAWFVCFHYGLVNGNDKSNSYYVRAVRAGQCRSLGSLVIGSPEQGGTWKLGTAQTILWEPQSIPGNVRITLSRMGGKQGTFETLAASTENDGTFEWTVSGAESVNCMLKIEPLDQPDKATSQGLFSIKYVPLSGLVSDMSTGTPLSGVTLTSDKGGSIQTAGNGNYSFELSPGTYTVTFSKAGYQTRTISDVEIKTAESTELNVEMTPPGPLNIVTINLPGSETGVAYTSHVRISGGVFPYTYSILNGYGTLPPGLSLDDKTGTITGTPTTRGTYTFSVGVTDSQNAYAEREFSIEVTERLQISTPSLLARGTQGTIYFKSIKSAGGTLPHSFARISGALPPGLSLSAPGVLTGTPTTSGSYDFIVRVTDASNRTIEKAFHLEVVDPLLLTTTRLNNGIVGQAYSQSLAASGGYGARAWLAYSGSLPAGLALDSQTGLLSGTPTEATSRTVVFAVSDEENRVTYKDLVFQVCDPLGILTSAVPNALVGSQYSEAIRLNGGIGPYTFSYSGQLPAGLSLNTATGVISGTPTTAGFVNVSISVVDNTFPMNQTITQNLGVRTTNNLTITSSAVLPKAKKDVAMNPLILKAGGGPSPYTWAIVGGQMPSGITLDPLTGQIAGTPRDRGDFVFTLQVIDNTQKTAQKEFFLRVSDTLSLTTGAVPDGAKGKSYSFAFQASGGLLPHTWRVKSGTLPSGLLFNGATGTLYGTPTTRQTYAFTLEVSDDDSPAQTAEKNFIIEIQDELYIYTRSIPNGRKDKAYTTTLQAQLGTPPYAWRIDSGVLPQGLVFKSSTTVATLEGTPTQTGTFVFTVRVTDQGSPQVFKTQEFTLKIYDEVVIETSKLKNANRGIPYSDNIVVSGGAIPYSWKIISGSLPAGLTLNSTSGLISGTTNLVSGHSSALTVRVTDGGTPSGYAEKELVVWVLDPLKITTASVQKALQKAPFHAGFQGEGGIAPFAWSVKGGSLPEGLTLDPSTGTLSGTPALCGTFDFTLGLADDAQVTNTVTRAFQLEVICCNDYEITGTIPGRQGVTLTLGGDAAATTTTNAGGNFTFEHLAQGNYTLTPTQIGYKFDPQVLPLTDLKRDLAGLDFTARVNLPPNKASKPVPGDNALNIGLNADLAWAGGDPDAGDVVVYDVYFGTTATPGLLNQGHTATTLDPGDLNGNTTYYWKIVSRDSHGGETSGPVWQFTTVNRKPNLPSVPAPKHLGIDVGVDTAISWTGGDPDAGDTVVYDVYFGTAATPGLLNQGHTATTLDPGDLNGNTTYYWKIVSRDSHGGETPGPVWRFTTVNRKPHVPSTPSPGTGQKNMALDAVLAWTGGDPDVGDIVSYDIYFGTEDPPLLKVAGHKGTGYDPGRLSTATTYYWRVTAMDSHGGKAEGPLWNFKTITPGQVQFKTAAFSVTEDQERAAISLTRSNGSYGKVSVTFVTGEGTARSGLDYTAVSTLVTFDHGQTSQTVLIPIINDERLEGDETVILTLSEPTGDALLGKPATAVLTIRDDAGDVVAGDVDGSGRVDLNDLMMVLKIVTGEILKTPVHKGADVNGDGRIGEAEMLYILQRMEK